LDQSYTPKLQECGHWFIQHLAVPNLQEVSSSLRLQSTWNADHVIDRAEMKNLFECDYDGFVTNSQLLLQSLTLDRIKKDRTKNQHVLRNVTIIDANRANAVFISRVRAGLEAHESKPDTVKCPTIGSAAELASTKLSMGLDNVVNGVTAKFGKQEKATIPKPQAILGVSNGTYSFAEELHKLGELKSGVVFLTPSGPNSTRVTVPIRTRTKATMFLRTYGPNSTT
jgi:hypothetical protein